jgi:mono/diheme cytochrome c family protein
MIPRSSLALVSLLALSASAYAADPVVAGLVPLKPEVRKVLDQSCVICHGEVIDGEKETRDDVDLSTDDAIRQTVENAGKMKYVIETGKMPHKTKLSRRLRGDAKLQERLTALRAEYDANGSKEVLMTWLKDVVAAKEEDMKKKD